MPLTLMLILTLTLTGKGTASELALSGAEGCRKAPTKFNPASAAEGRPQEMSLMLVPSATRPSKTATDGAPSS